MPALTKCAVCGGPLVQVARGRRRIFCRQACRQQAFELRRWAREFAPVLAEDWRSIEAVGMGRPGTADRILEEAALIEAGCYQQAIQLRRAALDRQHEELKRIWSEIG
jgi:endogenous inhibitor of DNA gyrase (YacG/DUF329 family)